MNLKETIASKSLVLAEAAVIETLRRNPCIPLHPLLENALVIYDGPGRQTISDLYTGFIDLARTADIPIIICTPTWRANKERIQRANAPNSVNSDAADMLLELRATYGQFSESIFIGGLIGCRGDCYRPQEALSVSDAQRFHSWQVAELARSEIDFLMAATLPALSEATGIARAIQKTRIPYIISFVINSRGRLLDETDLEHAFKSIDEITSSRPPLGYMINCAYPSFLNPAGQSPYVFERLIGFQANASSKEHSDLDDSAQLQMDDISDWGNRMIALNKRYGVKILGGCCGTNIEHLKYIIEHL